MSEIPKIEKAGFEARLFNHLMSVCSYSAVYRYPTRSGNQPFFFFVLTAAVALDAPAFGEGVASTSA